MSPIKEHLLDAVAVISWEVPDEELAAAVNAQTKLMAGVTTDEYCRFDSETSTH